MYRTYVMHWTTCLMPKYPICGVKSPGNPPHWDSGTQSYWREMNSSLDGCSKVDQMSSG